MYKFWVRADKSKFPAQARKLSFVALFFTEVFALGNKIWPIGWIYITIIFMSGFLDNFNFDLPQWTSSILFFVAFMIKIDFFIKGRVWAWSALKLDPDNHEHILIFNNRQKKILIISLIVYTLIFLFLY